MCPKSPKAPGAAREPNDARKPDSAIADALARDSARRRRQGIAAQTIFTSGAGALQSQAGVGKPKLFGQTT